MNRGINVILRFFHDVYEMNVLVYRAGHVLLSVRLSIYFNLRTAGRILIKFGMGIMTLDRIPNLYILISYNQMCLHDGYTNLWGGSLLIQDPEITYDKKSLKNMLLLLRCILYVRQQNGGCTCVKSIFSFLLDKDN
jgi:hypothetical protein